MPSGRKKNARKKTEARGPSGSVVFLCFLVLAALCVTAGFGLGSYLLDTLGERIGGGGGGTPTGGGGTPTGGGTTPPTGDGSTGGATPPADPGGSGGGATDPPPAGGGAGSVVCKTSPLIVYSIQIGAFSSRVNAEKAVTDLGAKDLPGFVVEPSGATTLFRTRTVALTKRDVAEAAQAQVKTKGYPDCFLAVQTLAASRKTITGSSTQYLERAAKGVETLLSCLRIEGDIWDEYRAGNLDRQAATTKVEALISSVREAKDGLSALKAPSDLAAAGEAIQTELIAASANLQALKSYLSGQSAADRRAAESSFLALVDGFARLEEKLGS